MNNDFNTPIPFKNFDSNAWQKNWTEPDWRGKNFIISEQDVFDYFDRTSKAIQIEEKRPYGFDRYIAIIHKTFNDQVIVLFSLAQSIFTASAGSNVTTTSDPTWNNASNTVECIGGGGSGGAAQLSASAHATGGGAGCYSKITNYNITTPGTTQFLTRVGLGGTAVSGAVAGTAGALAGNSGGASWFGPTSQTTDPGNGTDNTKCSGAAGGAGQATNTTNTTLAGGTGGATASSWGQTKYAGGTGGAIGTGTHYSSTGGGAPGVTNTGGNGTASNATLTSFAGGAATGDSGGTSGNALGGAGGNGTFFGTVGAGGGGGGNITNANALVTGGAAGNYGAGGGSATNYRTSGVGSVRATSAAGSQGIVVLTWTPSVLGRSYGYIIG